MPGSGIREIAHRALELPGVIRLEVGESDFVTPRSILEQAFHDCLAGYTRYTASGGYTELREALCEKLSRVNKIDVGADQVVVTPGAVHGLFLILTVLCDPGDEVLLPNPGWPNYRMMCTFLGITTRSYSCPASREFRPDIQEIKALLSPRTRAIVVNTPHNPTGRAYERAFLSELLAVGQQEGITIVSDEAYDEVYFDTPPVSLGALGPAEEVPWVSVFTFSKTYAMTGLRVGYVVGPRELVSSVTRLHESTISCVSAFSQRAALAALVGSQKFVEKQRTLYHTRRDLVAAISGRYGIETYLPDGTFYMMIPIGKTDSRAFAVALLERDRIAVAPGSAFGSEGEQFIRVCFAGGGEKLGDAIETIVRRTRGIQENGMEVDERSDCTRSAL